MSKSRYKSEDTPRQIEPLWCNRDYVCMWLGRTFSSIGSGVSQLAFPLLVLLLTNSPASAGLVSALRFLPYMLVGLPAGVLVDRLDRRKVMLVSDVGRMLCLVSVPIAMALGSISIFQLYAVALMEGCFFIFYDLARLSCLPCLVSEEQLSAAVMQNEVIYSISSLSGPLLGGVLYQLNHTFPFFIDSISYLISLCTLFLIQKPLQDVQRKTKTRLFSDINEGIRWLWKQKKLCSVAVQTAGFVFLLAANSLLLITFAKQHQASPSLIGLMFTIGSTGNVLGSLLAVLVSTRLSLRQTTIMSFWLAVCFWVCYLFVSSPILFSFIFAGISLLESIFFVANSSFRLASTPCTLQGRVNSIFRLVLFGCQSLGFALAGLLLEHLNSWGTLIAFWSCLVVLALVATVNPYMMKRNA